MNWDAFFEAVSLALLTLGVLAFTLIPAAVFVAALYLELR